MVVRGTVVNGVIAPDDRQQLPDGTRVLIEPVDVGSPSEMRARSHELAALRKSIEEVGRVVGVETGQFFRYMARRRNLGRDPGD